MAFASSNRTAVRRVEELVLGITPVTPAFIDTRYTSESINYTITNITSNEIRADRQTSDLVQTEADVTGAVDFELSYASFDDLFIHALGDPDGFSADYGIAAAAVTAVDGAAAGFSGVDFVAAGVLVGDWVRSSGFTNAANNGYFRAKLVTVTDLVVEDGSQLVAEVGTAVELHGGKIHNDVTERSTAWEKEFGDAFVDPANPAPVFVYFNGMRTCGFTLNVNVGEILTGSFNFQGTTASVEEVELTQTDVSVAGDDYVTALGDWVAAGFTVGMEVVGIGFTADGNNCVATVTAVTATNLTVTTGQLVVEAAGSRTIRSLNPPRFAGATTVAANTNQVMNAVGNVVQVNDNGKISSSCFNTLTINYDNNCRPIDCVGTLGHKDIKFGRVEVTGTIGLFFENTLQYQRFLNGEAFSFAFHVEDAAGPGQARGNGYTFNFPFAKYETGQLVSEGLDTNIFFNADFRVLVDRGLVDGGTGMNTGVPTELRMFSITKYDAV